MFRHITPLFSKVVHVPSTVFLVLSPAPEVNVEIFLSVESNDVLSTWSARQGQHLPMVSYVICTLGYLFFRERVFGLLNLELNTRGIHLH